MSSAFKHKGPHYFGNLFKPGLSSAHVFYPLEAWKSDRWESSLFLSLDAWSLLDCSVFFWSQKTSPGTDFMKPVDTGCSHGSRAPVSESKVAEGKPLGFFFFLTMCHLLREEEMYAILHCLRWVCVSMSAKKHQEWKRFSTKGHVKVILGEGGEKLWFGEQKKLKEILRNVYSQYSMPSQGHWSHYSGFFITKLP